MRKIVKRQDGAEETIEGTPEEIREYERIAENDRNPRKPAGKPEVLKGDESELAKNLRRIAEAQEERERRERRPFSPLIPTWIPNGYCSTCMNFNCRCKYLQPFWPPYTIICGGGIPERNLTTVTSDRISLLRPTLAME